MRPSRTGRRLPWNPALAVRLAIVAGRCKHRLQRMAVKGALGAAGVVFVVVAVLFLFLAAYHWLSGRIGPVAAAASVGGALLVVGLLALALAFRSGGAEAVVVAENPSAEVASAPGGLRDVAAAATSHLRKPLVRTAGLALLAGILIGRRKKKRR